MDDIYKIIEEYNLKKKRKALIVFGDMIADMLRNKKLNPMSTEFFITDRKLNTSLAFIMLSCFTMPKNIILCTFFLQKFQKSDNFNKLHLIVHQILTLETL